MFRCLGDCSTLFDRRVERIVAQVFHDLCVMGDRREHLVAFPPAERYCANFQDTSRFRLEDFQLEASPAKVTADGGWLSWDLYAPVVRW